MATILANVKYGEEKKKCKRVQHSSINPKIWRRIMEEQLPSSDLQLPKVCNNIAIFL